MLEEKHGTIKVEWGLRDLMEKRRDPHVSLRWTNHNTYEDDVENILIMSRDSAKNLIQKLETALEEMDKKEKRMNMILSSTNFYKLYDEFDKRYNPYPVQMSRAEAFGKALGEGLICKDVYDAAHEYYGNLWCYVGD